MAHTGANTVVRTEYPHIIKIEGVAGGEAIVEGTRIAVWNIVGYYYRLGLSIEEIVSDWDYLEPAQVFSALAYYHDHQAEIELVRGRNSYEYWHEHDTHAPA